MAPGDEVHTLKERPIRLVLGPSLMDGSRKASDFGDRPLLTEVWCLPLRLISTLKLGQSTGTSGPIGVSTYNALPAFRRVVEYLFATFSRKRPRRL